MEQHDPVVGQKLRARAEERVELRAADVLEHTHRNDPVEPPPGGWQIAIVGQFEADPVGNACALRARDGERELFLA